MDTFRNRAPLFYLDALAAKAWLEKRTEGHYRPETERELGLFAALGCEGQRELLKVQGFLS